MRDEAAVGPQGTQGRARPRVGAATMVLGALWYSHSRRRSAGVSEIGPSLREVGRGPAGFALDSGQRKLRLRGR